MIVYKVLFNKTYKGLEECSISESTLTSEAIQTGIKSHVLKETHLPSVRVLFSFDVLSGICAVSNSKIN